MGMMARRRVGSMADARVTRSNGRVRPVTGASFRSRGDVGQGLVLGLERPLPLRWRLGDPHYNAYCTRRGLKGAAVVVAAAPTHCFEGDSTPRAIVCLSAGMGNGDWREMGGNVMGPPVGPPLWRGAGVPLRTQDEEREKGQ